ISERVNERENNQAEREGDADVRHRAVAHVVDNNGSGAREDKDEGAEQLRRQLPHDPTPLRAPSAGLRYSSSRGTFRLVALLRPSSVGRNILAPAHTLVLPDRDSVFPRLGREV